MPVAPSGPPVDSALAARFARLALACVHQEYPNKIAHVLNADADARPPRELTPAFYGCFDWHSSVHGHWLARAYRADLLPEAPFAADARATLARSLTPENVKAEVLYSKARAGSASSGPAVSRGCCSSARSFASGAPGGTDLGRGARAARARRRSRASATGCRSSRSRSASASTRRRPSPSASSSTGRASPATRRRGGSSSRAAATSTAGTATVRSRTSRPARTSSRRAWARPI